MAGVRRDANWSGPLLELPFELESSVRSVLARHWLEAGLREHASIAAFARFTLQLLELGAPLGLTLDSQRAMSDETEHARRCFALASRYAGFALGPDTLPIAGALEAGSLASITRLTGEVRQTLRRELEASDARTDAAGGTAASPDDGAVTRSGLTSHGYMTPARGRTLLRAALAAIVVPCTQRLLDNHASTAQSTVRDVPADAARPARFARA